MSKNYNYVVLPSLRARVIAQYLTKQSVEHTLLSENEMTEEGVSPSCTYKGRYFDNNILCIKSELTEEEIYKIDDKTKHTKLN